MKDFHPISLVENFYKIISNVLVCRLKKVMQNLISSFQTSFIKGRQILDGILIANKYTDVRQKSLKVVCSVNWILEKPLTTDHGDLNEVLFKMGFFGKKWRARLKNYYSIIIKGISHGSLQVKKA